MKKRILSIFLMSCMLFAMLPAAAWAATPAPVYVGGTNVVYPINTILYYTSDGHGGITEVGAHSQNYVVKYDPFGTTPTLTLKGANITQALTTNAGYANETKYGIYTNGDLNIVLANGTTNTITGADSNAFSYGVCVVTGGLGGGSLAISGNGTLNVSGGSINVSGSDTANYGLCVANNLTISSGTINASCPNDNAYAKYSFGINTYGTLTVSGGTVTANGGKAINSSFGMNADEEVTISGGTVTASGGVAGINYGLDSTNNITISGGTVNVSCPSANYTTNSIYALDTLTVSGGTVSVSANNTTVNYGLVGSEQLVFSGGTVTAAGKTKAITTAAGTTIFSGSYANGNCFVKAGPNVNGTDTDVITSRATNIFSGNPGYKYVTISPILHAVTPTITNDLSTSEVKYTLNGTADPLDATASVTDGGMVTYDWYSNTTNTTEGGTRLDVDTAVYTPSTAAAGTAYYYCVVTNTIEDNGDHGTKTATAASAVAHITVKNASPVAPSCHFSFDGPNACKLMGATTAMEYSLNDGVSYTGCSDDMLLVAADITVNKGIKVRFRETDDTYVGPTLTFRITKAATPTLTPTQPYNIGGSGSIPMTTIHEYSVNGGDTWIPAAGTTTLAAATYLVRVKARGTSMASNTQSITLTAYTGIPETSPAALVYYLDEKLTELTANGSYAVNGTNASADGAGELAIGNSWFGTTISLVKKGDGITTNDSEAQSITLAARPEAPACTVIQPSANSATGVLSGITTEMQYTTGSGITWTDGTGSNVTGLVPGTVLVRTKATSSAPAGFNQTIIITAFNDDDDDDNESNAVPAAPVITVSEVKSKLFSKAGDIKVEADVSSAFGRSVTVEIADITESQKEIFSLIGANDKVYPFDISLFSSKSGEKVQPKDGYSVKITLPVPEELLGDREKIKVVYGKEGNLETLNSQLFEKDGKWYIFFEAVHFSPYALVVSTTPANPWTNPFSDVKEGNWYYSAVQYVAQNGLMNGTGSNAFSPEIAANRSMIATILYKLNSSAEAAQSTFKDVTPSADYAKAVAWAQQKGIITGYGNGMFGPDDSITREQLATMLWRYAGSPAAADSKGLAAFKDVGEISEYAENALAWANQTGIINGKGGSLLDPKGKATRAEVAQMMQNFMQKADLIK